MQATKLTVRDLMQKKVVRLEPSTTVREAIELIQDAGITGAPVVDAQTRARRFGSRPRRRDPAARRPQVARRAGLLRHLRVSLRRRFRRGGGGGGRARGAREPFGEEAEDDAREDDGDAGAARDKQIARGVCTERAKHAGARESSGARSYVV